MSQLVNLQFTMFLLIFAGWFLMKSRLVSPDGQKGLTNLVLYLVLPCNILESFLMDFSAEILQQSLEILLLSLFLQIFSELFGRFFYARKEPDRKKCLRYSILCSNAGFLGNPIAEGVFGATGLLLASIYLIPQRIMMWSSGLAIFQGEVNKKELFKKVMTHPCIITCILGLILMVGQWSLPPVLNTAVANLASCNTSLSMLVIGMILAEGSLQNLFDKDIWVYCLLRLLLIPGGLYLICRLIGLPHLVTGVSVLLAAMPAGATTSILASKYDRCPAFAAQLVVVSTVVSLATTFGWSVFLS